MNPNPDEVFRGCYRVVRELSTAGATSVVHELYHIPLKQHRVLKRGVVRGRVTAARLSRLFDTEAEVLRRLEAKGVFAPALFEYDPAIPELIMTLFSGPPLRWLLDRWVRGGEFPEDARLVRFARRLTEAVARCHERGVVLADLKPDNVLVERGDREGEGVPVLIDFGSAVLLDRPPDERDFTPGYAAPELIRGGPITPAADLWSLGAIFYALFRRGELGTAGPPRGFGERETAVLPSLQSLTLELLAEDPAARPVTEAVIARLTEAEAEVSDGPVGAPCPKCGKRLPAGGAKFCSYCTAAVSRETRQYNPASKSSDPIRQMYDAERDGRIGEGVYWAKVAFGRQQLSPQQRLTALELAVQIPSAMPFAGELIAATDIGTLPDDVRRSFLGALVRYLRATGGQFAPYRAALSRGTAEWPEDELLWVGLSEATPTPEREQVLQDALARLPDSRLLREALGDVLVQTGRPAEAARAWIEAVEAGAREPALLCRVWWTAVRCPGPEDAEITAIHERVVTLLRGLTPRTVADAKRLLSVAEAQWRRANAAGEADATWRYDLAEAALALEPGRTDFQEAKATALFDQQKYLLAAEWVARSGYTPLLREVLGKAHYELGQYEQARQVLEELTGSTPTPARYGYLIRTFAKLKKAPEAREAIVQGYRKFPNDPDLRNFYGKL